MLKKLLFVALLLPVAANAQSVQQSGTITPGHIPWWVTSGVIGDGGSSVDSPITSIGVTNNGGAGICVSSARQTAAGRNQLCFGASTNAPATISLQNYGTATPQGLNFVINGTVVNIPTGGGTFIFGNGPFTVGDVPCFSTTAGVVIDCGLAVSAGTVTTGAWQGTPVGLNYGGTGATSAAGARTNLGLGTMAQQNANAVAITGGTITGMPTPTNSTDVAIKSYVDANASGLNILASSGLATAAILPNTPTYSNGTLGVGATLTAGSNTTLTVDGTAAPLNTVVLVKNQASAFQNGIYTVTTAGSGSVPWVLTRATYFDQAAEMKAGSYTFVTGGATLANSSWTLQAAVTTVGTDPLTFAQFSSGSSGTVTSAQISAGTGTAVSGTCTITSAGNCTVSTNGGVDANTLNTQVSNYTIQASDCGGTVQAGTGATGFFTITLPAVSGFSAVCTINVKNADTGRAKALSGFPSDVYGFLWPLQSVTVKIINGVWATTRNPGRWIIPSDQELCVAQNGNDANDGLGAGTGCLQHIQTAVTRIGQQWDGNGYNACSIGLYAGGTSTFAEGVSQTGQSVGCYLTINIRGAITWTSSTGYCWSTGDGGILVWNANLGFVPILQCNTGNLANTGAFFCHQTCIMDINGAAEWIPGGTNDTLFYIDSNGRMTVSSTGWVIGDGANRSALAIGYCVYGCRGLQISGSMGFSANMHLNVTYALNSTSIINSNATWPGASASSASTPTGGSVLITNGTSIPGSTSPSPGVNPVQNSFFGIVCTSKC